MPRPILKRGSSPPLAMPSSGAEEVNYSGEFPFPDSSLRHVNFPCSRSELVKEHTLDSTHNYDRSPIVVDKTYSCALPARGCPGRTFMDPRASQQAAAAALHPRALFSVPTSSLQSPSSNYSDEEEDDEDEDQHTPTSRYPHPPLPPVPCPELCSSSSESDESSDGFASPIPDAWSYGTTAKQTAYDSACFVSTTPTQDRPLSFLPHPNPHSPGAHDNNAAFDNVASRRPRFRKDGSEPMKRAGTPKPRKVCRVMAGLGFGGSNEECLGGF